MFFAVQFDLTNSDAVPSALWQRVQAVPEPLLSALPGRACSVPSTALWHTLQAVFSPVARVVVERRCLGRPGGVMR